MKRFLGLFVIASFLATPTIATAKQDALERARILFDAGVQAYTVGRYEDAVESFNEAYTLTGKPQVLFSLAQAERRVYAVSQDARYLRQCIAHFRKYLELVTDGGRRGDAAEALEQLEVLAARETNPAETTIVAPEVVVGKILISSTTPGATISIDGAKASESPALAVVKPGKHLVHVSAPGYITEEREMVAIEKTLVPLEISLREQPAYLSLTTHDDALITIDGRLYGQAPVRKPIEMRSGPHTVRVSLAGYHSRQTSIALEPGKTNSVALTLHQTRQRVTSYVLLGASGAAFLGVGVQSILALRQESAGRTILRKTDTGNITQSQLDDYNASLVSRDRLRNSSLITLTGASVLGLAGAVTYLYDTQRTTDDTSTNRNSVAISFTLTPSIAGIDINGRF